jgi:class 3 adenylate cyclase
MGTPLTNFKPGHLEEAAQGADSKRATSVGRSIDLAHESPFELAALRVSPASRQVRFGPKVQSLEPRIMQVLVVLARHRGQVVSRQDLVDACWGGRIVGDDTLNRCIAAIRRLAEAYSGFAITTVARVGYRLDESASPRIGLAPTTIVRNERRHLTALSCTLHRPAGLTTRLDPEEWHAIVTEYRRSAAGAVEQWGGYIADRSGDRLVAYFGLPQAREDAAERAVRAGLAIVESMVEVSARVSEAHDIRLAVQIGIHAAVVVVARDSAGNLEIFGEASDIAALVQAEAAPDTVLMTRAVHELVADAIASEEQRTLQLADIGAPLQLYRAPASSSNVRPPSRRERTPFIGRKDALHSLIARLNRARDAAGQVVFVTGEPGIGKSRLIAELKASVQSEAHTWIECAGAASFHDSPFHAITQLFEQGLDVRSAERPVARLEQALKDAGVRLSDAVPLIAELLNLPIPANYPTLQFGPEQKRKRLFAAVLDWIFSATKTQPLVLVIEDLQWVHPWTLELIQVLADQAASAALLLVCTARPEFPPPWPPRAHRTRLALDRMNDRETRELVTGVRSRRALTADEVATVIDRSDGVPWFAEELTHLTLESNRRLSACEIPATLRDCLAARLDRLEDAKGVAQLSAVLGREFSYEMLHTLCPMPEAALQAALSKLADAELIQASGSPPDSRYAFRRALIRDAAYDSLPKSERLALHARAARALTSRTS